MGSIILEVTFTARPDISWAKNTFEFLYCVKSVRMRENGDQNNSEYEDLLRSVSRPEVTKTYRDLLRIHQKPTRTPAKFLKVIHYGSAHGQTDENSTYRTWSSAKMV